MICLLDSIENVSGDEMNGVEIKTKGICPVRIMLKDVFSFAEHQEKATYGLGFQLTLTRNKDEAVSDKAAGIADARIRNNHIHWYILRDLFS